jgi:hypothetical protein
VPGLRLTKKCSSASTRLSLTIVRVICCVVTPELKLRMPLARP